MLNKNKNLKSALRSILGWFVAFLICGLSFAMTANALHLTIDNRQYPLPLGPGASGASNAAADAMENQFNNSIGSGLQVKDFLSAQGNANATSGRTFLVPGVSTQSDLMVAFVASGALALGPGASLSNGISIPQNSLPPVGVGAKTGLSVAASGHMIPSPFRGLDPNRVMLHASFFKMNLSPYIGHGVTMNATQAAIGMSYEMFSPKPWSPLIRFNGIRLSSGLSYNTFDASYQTPFNLSQSSGGVTTTWNNNIDIGVSSKVYSLSTEATTGFRLAWLLNFYTGLGVDFNFGSTSIVGGSSGPVTGSVGGSTVFTGTGTVSPDPSDSSAPTFAQLRWLLGTQIDVGNVGIFVQGTLSTPSTYALHVGAKAAF